MTALVQVLAGLVLATLALAVAVPGTGAPEVALLLTTGGYLTARPFAEHLAQEATR